MSKSGVKEVDFSNSNKLTSVGDYFLAYCTDLNSGVELPKATTIGTYFLCFSSVCGKISLPEVTVIKDNFCLDCFAFNHELSVPKAETINIYFLSGAKRFNQPLDLPSVTTIGHLFMSNGLDGGDVNPGKDFNQPVDFSDVTSIGQNALSGNRNLNSIVTLPTDGSIAANFMDGCSSFNKDIYIPATIRSIGLGFLRNCENMLAITYCNAPASILSTTDNSSFSDSDPSAARYVQGAKLSGTYAADWHTRLPDSSSSPYRKIIEV